MSIDVIIESRHRHREEQRRRANSEHDFDALKRIDVVLVHYITKDTIKMEKKEQEITYTAVPVPYSTDGEKPAVGVNEPPIPAGHSRFYCKSCQQSYDLPDRATSWRCSNCHTFNTTQPGECEWCIIQ